MKITNKITAGILAAALASFCVPSAAIAIDNVDKDSTSGGTYVTPTDTNIYMTYGDTQTFTATYVSAADLGENVTAAWAGTGLDFDKTSLTVSCEKKTETSTVTSEEKTYYVYTTTVSATTNKAGDITLKAAVGGNWATINGVTCSSTVGITVKVAKKRIEVPAPSKTVFVYQKDLKQYPAFAESDYYTVIYPAASIEKGSYKATIKLTDIANTEWATIDEKTGENVADDAANKTVEYSIVDRDYQSELEALQKNYDAVNAELATTKQLLVDSQTVLQTTESKLADSQEKLTNTQEKLVSTQEKLAVTQEKLETTQDNLDVVNENLAEAEATNAVMTENYDSIKIKNTTGKTIKLKIYNPATGKYKTLKVKSGKSFKIAKCAAID